MVVEEAINRKLTKVALFADATNYGASGRDDMLDQIKKQGNKLEVVTIEKWAIGDKDMTAQLLKSKSLGAQAILIWGIGPELAAVSNGMAKLGLKVPLIGGWPLSMSNYLDNAGANGNGTLMPQTFIEAPITPRAKGFIESYHKAYGVTRIPSPVSAAQGYDAVLIFAAAVKQAGSTDSLKIRDALEDLKEPVDGVIALWKKPYGKWDPTDVTTHEAFRREQTIMGMVQDGRVVFANESDKARLAKRGAK
jgi:branched-chain amino acid transport system substrate-binding protein